MEQTNNQLKISKTDSKMKIRLIIIIFILALVIVALAIYNLPAAESEGLVIIDGQKITVDLADTPQKQVQGLSGRDSLGNNQGMLFVFNNYAKQTFWMKDMNFPLDIIWIKDETIVDLSENLPPEGEKPARIYQPSSPINDVLEVSAGFISKNGLKIGDRVQIEAKN